MRGVNYQSGQSILEVIIAISIFAVVAAALTTIATGSFIALEQGGEQTQAEALAQEGLQAVRAIHDRAWNEIIFSTSSVAVSGGQWELTGEGTTETIGQFTRTISFHDVCRDISNDIDTCPTSYTDPHVKRVVSSVTWNTREGISNTAEQEGFSTNWDSRDWTQTNWVGGSGQSTFLDTTRYATSTGIDDGQAGQLELATTSAAGGGSWGLSGGTEVTDTSDTDFSPGTFSNTVTTGTGSAASIILTQTTQWTEHVDSASTTLNKINAIEAVAANDIWAVGASGEILHYSGASWLLHTDVGDQDILGMGVVSASDIWAGGEEGKIWHYDGNTWSEHTDTGDEIWNDFAVINASDVWVVGKSGRLAHWNGSTWTESSAPSGNDLNSADAVSSSDIWAVGTSGTIIHYNGTSWLATSSPTGNELTGVDMVSASDGWIAGASGTILDYDGASWSTASSPTGVLLRPSVFMRTTSDGWIAGDSGTILHYNGTSWSIQTSPVGDYLGGVTALAANDVWIVGDVGRILQFSEVFDSSGTFSSRIIDSGSVSTDWGVARWTEILPTGSDLTVSTRSGNTATPDFSWSPFSAELTAAGGSTITSPDGRFLQYRLTLTRATNPTQTSQLDDITIVYDLPTSNELNDLSIISASDIWAVGDSGTILYYNGTSWLATSSPTANRLLGVDAVSSSDVWAVGDSGTIIHYTGASWSLVSSPVGSSIWAVHAVSASDIWAVGSDGKIIRYNGTSWSEHTDTGAQLWNDVACTSASDCWAVGDQGLIFRYNGTSWSQHTDTGTNTWESVHCLSASRCWTSGNQGLIYEWNGTSWSQDVDSGDDIWLGVTHVDFQSGTEGWAVGKDGAIHFDDNVTGWTSSASPTAKDINAVALDSAQSGWAVGVDGNILRFVGAGPVEFESLGTLTSSAFDMGDASPTQIVEWDEIIPTCSPPCTVKIEVSTAPDDSGSPGTFTDFFGASGAGSFFTNASGTLISTDLNGNQWVRYRVTLSGDGSETPILTEVRLNYR